MKKLANLNKVRNRQCFKRQNLTTLSGGTLVNVEDKQTGLIGWNVYWYYFKRGGAAIFIFVIVFLLFAVTSRVMAAWWLTQWTRDFYGLPSPTCKLNSFPHSNSYRPMSTLSGRFLNKESPMCPGFTLNHLPFYS